MLDDTEANGAAPAIVLDELSFNNALSMLNGRTRLDTRFAGDTAQLQAIRSARWARR